MADDYTIKRIDEFEEMGGSGGATWRLARKTLGAEAFGFNVVDIEAGGEIPAHDHTGDDQEEVFVILEGDLDGSEELQGEVCEQVARRIGKLARPKRIIWTADVPKTRSGKIMRRLLRDIAEGRELGDVTTLADSTVMDLIKDKQGVGTSEE